MPLSPGTRFGPYEITGPVGAGGMGEVYRARDMRLERSVAVKILPQDFAHNAQLRLRFEREAKTISQLEHPNICRLYDVGDDYLVMELLEGETLADRILRGPLPLDDVLRYGIEIAEALDNAHQHGVVHRDLKPGNVMVTRSGAKLLDFGLARSSEIQVNADGATIQKALTQEGTIVGTFQYMAPEQLEGASVDHRTDLFALGAVLYEMATGRRAFQGSTKTSLIAAIVASQPAPLSQVIDLAPPALEHVIQRCLAKDPATRWQSARDVAEELKWIRAGDAPVVVTSRRKTRERLAWGVAALAAAAAVAVPAWFITRPVKRVVTSINAPEKTRFQFDNASAVLSPDGDSLAFVASGEDGRSALWVRRLSSPAARRLPGTEGATYPFWSPDSRSLAFFADGYLKRTDADGGPAERITEAVSGRGGSWGARDTIVFAPSTGDPLYAVQQNGENRRAVTRLPALATSHRLPSFLPDGVHFLFFQQGPSIEALNVFVGSTAGMEPRKLLQADGGAIWSDTGHVLFVRDGVLRARPFNSRSMKLEGEAVTLAEGVMANANFNTTNISAARGTLTYVAGAATARSRLVWYDRGTSKEIEAITEPGYHLDPRVSPDGRYVAYCGPAAQAGRLNVFLHDLSRRVSSRFTFGTVNEWSPVWSPDGKWIAYTSFQGADLGDIYVKAASGTGTERKVVGGGLRKITSDWTPDGTILYHAMRAGTSWDIHAFSLRDNRSRPLLTTPFAETGARVSPNGRWLVYSSSESGRIETYVIGLGGQSGKWQISSNGGRMPSWSPDGREIYFSSDDGKLMAALVNEQNGTLEVGIPQQLFSARLRQFSGLSRAQYSTADGRRFLLNEEVDDGNGATVAVTVVQNWERGMERMR